MKIEFSIDQIDAVANRILEQNPEKVILFQAEIGTGKTTLIKALCKALKVKETSNSPTFSIINEYETANGELLYHFDFYRLKSQQEALDFGVEEYLYSENLCFLEWAEKIPNLIPNPYTIIEMKTLKNGNREITIKLKVEN